MEETQRKNTQVVRAEPIELTSEKIKSDMQKREATLETVRHIADQAIGFFQESQRLERQVTQGLFRWVIGIVTLVVFILGALTYFGKLPGEALTLVIGIIIGSLITLIGPRIRGESPRG